MSHGVYGAEKEEIDENKGDFIVVKLSYMFCSICSTAYCGFCVCNKI